MLFLNQKCRPRVLNVGKGKSLMRLLQGLRETTEVFSDVSPLLHSSFIRH